MINGVGGAGDAVVVGGVGVCAVRHQMQITYPIR